MLSTQVLVARTDAAIATHRSAREHLLADCPTIDDQTLSDTLEGITDLREILAELVRSALEDEALLVGLSARMKELKARQRRLATRAEAKRVLALRAMVEADLKSLTEPDFTASVRRSAPSLEVVAEEQIPSAFWKPQPPKLDRHALLEALKDGAEIEGAAIEQSQVQLNVRTR